MKTISSLLLTLTFCSLLHAQDNPPKFRVSVNLGSQMTDINATDSQGESINYTNRLNFLNGIGLSYFNNNFIVDLNIDYYTVSSVFVDANINTAIKLGYLQPSVNVAYVLSLGNFPLRPRIGAGYGHAFLINGETQNDGTLTDVRVANTIANTDAGLNANVGVMVFNDAGISMSALYNYRHGLTNISTSASAEEMRTSIHALLIKIQLAL